MSTNRMKLTFFDDYWVDFRPGTTRRWFKPEYFSAAPSTLGYASLVYDPERKKYRVYYETLIDIAQDGPRQLKLLESEDMLHFTQVLNDEGGDVIFEGEGGVHGVSVMYDPLDPDPSRRYKFCGMAAMGKKSPCVSLAFSADGVHWENHPELVASPHISDALNKLYYNPCAEEYNLLHRAAFVDRRIFIRSSKDMKTWSEPRVLLHPAGVYNDGHKQTQHYSMSAGWFDGIFYGLLWRYTTDLHNLDFSKMFGVMDAELTYSYDGKEFLYTSGDTMIDRPMAPNPGWAGLAPADMCQSVDGTEYYILVGGYSFVHGTPESNKRLSEKLKEKGLGNFGHLVYKIRKDGFCGLESVGHGAKVVTKSIQLLSDDLTFNVRADCGSARFGLMKPNGQYLDGFSLDECIPFEFDQGVAVTPKWKEKTLKDAVGERVRIIVELNSAMLHAISATARPYIAQPQVGFADPQGIFEEREYT